MGETGAGVLLMAMKDISSAAGSSVAGQSLSVKMRVSAKMLD